MWNPLQSKGGSPRDFLSVDEDPIRPIGAPSLAAPAMATSSSTAPSLKSPTLAAFFLRIDYPPPNEKTKFGFCRQTFPRLEMSTAVRVLFFSRCYN